MLLSYGLELDWQRDDEPAGPGCHAIGLRRCGNSLPSCPTSAASPFPRLTIRGGSGPRASGEQPHCVVPVALCTPAPACGSGSTTHPFDTSGAYMHRWQSSRPGPAGVWGGPWHASTVSPTHGRAGGRRDADWTAATALQLQCAGRAARCCRARTSEGRRRSSATSRFGPPRSRACRRFRTRASRVSRPATVRRPQR
jgi:hypothetical protein